MESSLHDKAKQQKPPKKAGKALLDWYDRNHRQLPWRAPPHERPDPYHEWLSEIKLQQTTVPTVIPYFLKFIKKWPTIKKLAAAPREDVLREWAGLGYYARARNLHACAQIVANQHNGKFPDTEEGLLELPGIGPYTAAAITAIGFNKPAVAVDGNIERVISRYFAIETPLPAAKPEIKEKAALLYKTEKERHGDFTQAMMELGALVCTPKSPKCAMCPLNASCTAYQMGEAEHFPLKTAKKQRPQKYGHVYWIVNNKGQVLLQRRPEKGLFGGMLGFPTSDWVIESKDITAKKPFKKIKPTKISVSHTFTHFDLHLTVQTADAGPKLTGDYVWYDRTALNDVGLPTLFKKALNMYEKSRIRSKTKNIV